MADEKDIWDKADIFAKIILASAVPLTIAFLGYQATVSAKDKDVATLEFLRAMEYIDKTGAEADRKRLRSWSEEILNQRFNASKAPDISGYRICYSALTKLRAQDLPLAKAGDDARVAYMQAAARYAMLKNRFNTIIDIFTKDCDLGGTTGSTEKP